MLANFFMVTCPYLYDLETVAYFALIRNRHSVHALSPIRNTTQILLDVYHHEDACYIRPIKVQQRYEASMHRLHRWEEDGFRPVDESCVVAEVLSAPHRSALESAIYRLDVWNRAFLHAEEAFHVPCSESEEEKAALFRRLLHMLASRGERMFALAEKYFDLEDLVNIGRRTIGTGPIGGKAIGMLLARAILRNKPSRIENAARTPRLVLRGLGRVLFLSRT